MVPYLVIGLANTTAGILNPEQMPIMMSAAAATFLSNLGLMWLAVTVRPIGPYGLHPLSIRRSAPGMLAGLSALVTLVAGLGPGLPRPRIG